MSLLTPAFRLLFRMSGINFSEIPMLLINGDRRHGLRPSQQLRDAFADVRNAAYAVAGIANARIKAAKRRIFPRPSETFDRSPSVLRDAILVVLSTRTFVLSTKKDGWVWKTETIFSFESRWNGFAGDKIGKNGVKSERTKSQITAVENKNASKGKKSAFKENKTPGVLKKPSPQNWCLRQDPNATISDMEGTQELIWGTSANQRRRSINSQKRSITKTAKTYGIAVIRSGVTELATPNDNVVLQACVSRKKRKTNPTDRQAEKKTKKEKEESRKKTQQIKKFLREGNPESLPL